MRQWLQVVRSSAWPIRFAWCAVAAHDAQQKSAAERFQAWKAAAAQKLGARADADSLATAAALLFAGASAKPGADAAALDLAARASALAPSDAAIAWLRLQLCRAARIATSRCRHRDALIAADNAAAWLPNCPWRKRMGQDRGGSDPGGHGPRQAFRHLLEPHQRHDDRRVEIGRPQTCPARPSIRMPDACASCGESRVPKWCRPTTR